jgi:hypothetical protein
VNWECSQGMDLSSLVNINKLERLDDIINTPMESLVDRHKKMHKERGARRRMGTTSPRYMIFDVCIGFFGCIGSVKGCDDSFRCDG